MPAAGPDTRVGTFTVSGPDLDLQLRGYTLGAATSRAITAAQHAHHDPASFYVRDETGRARWRVDRHAGGATVYDLDREAGDDPTANVRSAVGASPTPRSGSTQPRGQQEDDMPTTGKNRKRRAARATSRATSRQQAKKVEKVSGKQAAVSVLKRAGGPLPVAELVTRVLRQKGVQLNGKTPHATIAAMLSIENGKPDGLFVRTAPGEYALREAK